MSQRLSTTLLASCVFLGLLWPELASLARPLLMPSIFVLLVCTLLTLDVGDVRRALTTEGRLLALVCLWQLLAAPLITALALSWLRVSPQLQVMLIVSACAGPIFSAPAFARLLHLDAPLMTAIVLTTTLCMPLALMLWSALLLASTVALDFGVYVERLLVFIALPLVLATLLKWMLGAARVAASRDRVSLLVILCLTLFALAVMDGVSARLVQDPALITGFLVAAVFYNLASQGLTTAVFVFTGRVRALTAGLAAGYRNLALVLAMTGAMVGADFSIYVGVAQIPMYVLPLLLTPVYRRLTAVAQCS